MKIKISKIQWKLVGYKGGWMKSAEDTPVAINTGIKNFSLVTDNSEYIDYINSAKKLGVGVKFIDFGKGATNALKSNWTTYLRQLLIKITLSTDTMWILDLYNNEDKNQYGFFLDAISQREPMFKQNNIYIVAKNIN